MFSAFTCANNIGSLVNSLFGVKTFNYFPSFTSSLLLFNGCMSDKYLSSTFCLLDFTLSAIESSGSNFTLS